MSSSCGSGSATRAPRATPATARARGATRRRAGRARLDSGASSPSSSSGEVAREEATSAASAARRPPRWPGPRATGPAHPLSTVHCEASSKITRSNSGSRGKSTASVSGDTQPHRAGGRAGPTARSCRAKRTQRHHAALLAALLQHLLPRRLIGRPPPPLLRSRGAHERGLVELRHHPPRLGRREGPLALPQRRAAPRGVSSPSARRRASDAAGLAADQPPEPRRRPQRHRRLAPRRRRIGHRRRQGHREQRLGVGKQRPRADRAVASKAHNATASRAHAACNAASDRRPGAASPSHGNLTSAAPPPH
jgi:hypothetical protein